MRNMLISMRTEYANRRRKGVFKNTFRVKTKSKSRIVA